MHLGSLVRRKPIRWWPGRRLVSDAAKASYDSFIVGAATGFFLLNFSVACDESFNENRAALVVNGPWFLGEIAEGVPFGVAPLPIVSATGSAPRLFNS